MKLIEDDVKNEIREFFKDAGSVDVVAILDKSSENCHYCDYIKQMLEEVKELYPLLSLQIHEKLTPELQKKYSIEIDEVPIIFIHGSNEGIVAYRGIPSGYEFGLFIETLKELSISHTHLDPKIVNELKNINKDVTIKVYVTPTCPYCPSAGAVAYSFAALNPKIKSYVIEVTEFQEEGTRNNISVVPTIIVNDKVKFQGALPPEMFLKKVKEAIDDRR